MSEYFSNTVDMALKSLVTVTEAILRLPDFSPDNLRKAKQQFRDALQDVSVCDEIKQKLTPQNTKGGIKYLSFIKNYAELAEKYSTVTPTNLEQLI